MDKVELRVNDEKAVFRNGRRDLGLAEIRIVLPNKFIISENYLEPLLVQASRGDPVKSIRIENSVQLDLSAYESIEIDEGVTLAGGRTVREPGLRLYTTTRPRKLFAIAGDNVRITGVRIESPDMGVTGIDNRAVGIYVQPIVPIDNIEVDLNELSGWSWACGASAG